MTDEIEDDGADLIGVNETPEPAKSKRGPKRGAMREEDPRSRAARRAAELRDHLGTMDEGTDEFYINPEDVPDGWKYEWKRKTVFGAEDPAYQVALARAGWEPVPTKRHPAYMPDTGNYPTIERKGMILMERPLEIHEEAEARDYRKATNQVRVKESQLTQAGPGEFERSTKDHNLVKVRKNYESIPIPD